MNSAKGWCHLPLCSNAAVRGSVYSTSSSAKRNSCIQKNKGKEKGKAIPLQAWTGPESSRMLMLPDFKTVGT